MSKIITSCIYPPIPIRKFDWVAYRDPEGLSGYGETEDEAILELLLEEESGSEENDSTPFECDCGAKYENAFSVLVCRDCNHGDL